VNKTILLYGVLAVISMLSNSILAQTITHNVLEEFNTHYNKSTELNGLSLFAESIAELEIAIEIAKTNNLEEEYLNSMVTMGEMMRRTGDHLTGIELLESLPVSDKYPKIYVRKLGRLIALYMEGKDFPNRSPHDSIMKYTEIGLSVAENNGLKEQEATICNSYGAYQTQTLLNPKKGQVYFERSALLFRELKDSNNYVIAMCHIMHEKLVEEKFEEAEGIGQELLKIVEDKPWYGTKQTLYRTYSNRYLTVGDTLNYLKWKVKEKDEAEKLLQIRAGNAMSLYRVTYKTDKYKENATHAKTEQLKSEIELKAEKDVKQKLILFLVLLLMLIAGIVILMMRQKKLSKELEVGNKNYQILMVESNHRIKNNLQMITSMLEYASQDVEKSGPAALSKISSKIQTVSLLHKFLYNDIHNAFISVPEYFNEIINLYANLALSEFEIIVDICDVKIKSERIVYFGLILNELLANTIEHNVNMEQKIAISILKVNENFELIYTDGSAQNENAKQGTGSTLIKQLMKRIKATNITLDKNTGTYKFTFNASI
jgi:two-component sensor histidine kinase